MNYINNLIERIDQSECDDLIIFGDFNTPGYKWIDMNFKKQLTGYHNNTEIREAASIIHGFINKLKLYQINNYINVKGNTLDLIFVKNNNNAVCCQTNEPLSIIDPYHSVQFIEFKSFCNTNKNININKKLYNYYKADFDKISNDISKVDWLENSIQYNDVNKFLEFINYKIIYIVNSNTPKTNQSISYDFPWFFSKELQKSIAKKKKIHFFHKQYLQTYKKKSEYLKTEFENQRKLCNRLYSRDYNAMILNKESNVNKNPRNFWKIIKGNNKKSIPTVMKFNDIESNNNSEIVNLFAEHFSTVYKRSKLNLYPLNVNNEKIIDSINITELDIENVIKTTNLNTAAGPDEIHPVVIKNCSKSFILPLLLLFSKILESCTYPELWKISYITPVFKANDKCDISNYRPITTISIFAKLFEKMLFNKISHQLYSHIIPQQHGGVPGLSTTTNLLVLTEYIHKSCNEKIRTQVVYLDMVKAFDKVNHELLIHKLSQYGIRGNLLNLIKSYFCKRQLIVKYNNEFSNSFELISGIPQGSNLSSLFFITYVNDILNVVEESKLLLYIDDIKIYLNCSSQNYASSIQNDINRICDWAELNDLHFNIIKSCAVYYTKSNFNYNLKYFIKNNELINLFRTGKMVILVDVYLHRKSLFMKF